jgi:ABC-type amino acid transport substrate-binding protein
MIGVQRGGVGMQYLGERGLENFDDSTTPLAILKKLMAGRVDLWFASNATVAGNTKILGIDADEIELVLELENTHMYIAFNGDTSDATVAEWQSAYDSLVKEGKVAEILARYGLEGLYPTLP